ncbi:TetR/AcrR family transcriptional regulator [Iodobacter fluviatilis]|uniref:TetR family transcriptional regulator n=1 Tax=Iodobacter fluviatilis TaxID=537 RepID=A0A7G3G7E4_9NEIS|nr:TetR/AcrR family transcriptional regulator [Iodobacter fluviatilis]QBC43059.1 TetR family transcriptional regulator [Iodobacter fluviatilis]
MQPENKRWARRKEARPQEILAAALKLFVKKGFAATKMADIAKAAGVTCGTPYVYFSSKEEIFKAVVRELLLPQLARCHDLLSNFQGSSAELLRAMLQTWWQAMGESEFSAMPKLMIAEGSNFPEVAKIYQEEFVNPGNKMLRHLLQRGIASGEFRLLDIDYAIEVICAPIVMAMLMKHSLINCLPDELDPERFINTTLDLLLNGLLASPKDH